LNSAPNESKYTKRGVKSPTPITGTKSRIDSGAAELFVRNGYDGTSMRDLARRVGLQPSSLYGHVKSKHQLLFRVMDRLMDEVLARAREALSGANQPSEQVRRLVRANICQPGPTETALLQSELKNLRPRYRGEIIRKQREYRDLWLGVLRIGIERRIFKVRDPSLVFLGIDGALTHVERWFNPDGQLSREEVAEVFADWILLSLGYRRRRVERTEGNQR
jgi:AcrR family transcriptional regulator